jgi:hypothetical protein
MFLLLYAPVQSARRGFFVYATGQNQVPQLTVWEVSDGMVSILRGSVHALSCSD